MTNALEMAVVDHFGEACHLSLYNMFEDSCQTLADLEELYPIGKSVGIMQPYMKRKGKDGKVLISAYRQNIYFRLPEVTQWESLKLRNRLLTQLLALQTQESSKVKTDKLCSVCNSAGVKVCSRCKQVNYCS